MNREDESCIICYEKIGTLKFNTICSCKFYYHLDCYIDWVKVNPICLICRNPITEDKLRETINPLLIETYHQVRQRFDTNQTITNNQNNEFSNIDPAARRCVIIGGILFILLFFFVFFVTYIFYNS